MKRHFLFAAALMLALLAAPLGALALPGASVALPVSVEEQGTLPAQKQTYALRLAAVSPGAPLPPGAENGMFMLYLQGSDEEEFPLIEFSQPGVYRYTISQIPGENGQCTYDPAEYRVTVYAVLDNSGEMTVSAAIYGQQSSEKLPRATFINKYAALPVTGDSANLLMYLGVCAIGLSGFMFLALKKRSQ